MLEAYVCGFLTPFAIGLVIVIWSIATTNLSEK